MKIVPIFAEKLFAFHYNDIEGQDEYDRLLEKWNDPEYLMDFADKNKTYIANAGFTESEFIEQVLLDAEVLEENLLQYKDNDFKIDSFFQPLHNEEYKCKSLSLQKKKCKLLRLYAIRIDENCFVITGGAIKLTRTMQEHPDTQQELKKLNNCKNYLQSEGVFDDDSFYEIVSK